MKKCQKSPPPDMPIFLVSKTNRTNLIRILYVFWCLAARPWQRRWRGLRGHTCRSLGLEITWQAAGNITDGRQTGGTAGGQRGGRVHRGGRHGAQVRWIRLLIKPRRGGLWLPWVWPGVTKQRDRALFPQIKPCIFLTLCGYCVLDICIKVIKLCLYFG